MQLRKTATAITRSRKAKVCGAVAAGAIAVTLAGGGGAMAAGGAPVIGTASTASYTYQTINTGLSTTVISGSAVPVTGPYYTSASLTIVVPANTTVACAVFDGNLAASDVHVAGPYAMTSYQTLALTGYQNFTAGDPLSVACLDYSGPVSAFVSGTVTAVLAGGSGSSASAAAARPTAVSRAAQLQKPAQVLAQHGTRVAG